MKRFSSEVKFKGEWRVYQERIIKNYEKALLDGKLHIVAAPGSGKTILGLEIIRSSRLRLPELSDKGRSYQT